MFDQDELLSSLTDQQEEEELYAAVDLGSNSFQLTLARMVNEQLLPIRRVKQRVRLADGLDANDHLNEDAMQRGLDTLDLFHQQLCHLKLAQIQTVGTFTLRQASNAQDFLHRARKLYPYPIQIISGHEEARLIYQGVAHYHFSSEMRLVFDIGGGSTEFALGQAFDTKQLHSLPMGCVTFSKFFKDGEITEKGYKKAVKRAIFLLRDIEQRFSLHNWTQVIGTSGTVKALTEVASLFEPDQLDYLHKKTLNKIKKAVFKAGHVDRIDFAGIPPQRCKTLPAGLAIIDAIMQFFEISEFEYCSAALREGVLSEISERIKHHDIRERTAAELIQHYHVDAKHGQRVRDTAMILFNQVEGTWQLTDDHRSILSWAALLHEIGLVINTRGIQKHSAYILQNADLPGFNLEQQSLIASIVRNFRNKIKLESADDFENTNAQQWLQLVALLRLAVLMNWRRLDDNDGVIHCSASEQHLDLIFEPDWLDSHPLIRDALEQEQNDLLGLDFELAILTAGELNRRQ